METSKGFLLAALRLRSYPTYEEWKHNNIPNTSYIFYSSYPTYEEWKQIIINDL